MAEMHLTLEQVPAQTQGVEQLLESAVQQLAPRSTIPPDDLRTMLGGGLRVLVMDPHDLTREGYASEVARRGWVAEQAATPEEATLKFKATPAWHAAFVAQPSASEQSRDMPHFDAYSFARTLSRDVPLYLCTRNLEQYADLEGRIRMGGTKNIRALFVDPSSLPEAGSIDADKGRIEHAAKVDLQHRRESSLVTAVQSHYWKIDLKGRTVAHLKGGGSVGDLTTAQPGELEPRDPTVLDDFAQYVLRFAERNPDIPIYMSPGGGPLNQIVKMTHGIDRASPETRNLIAADILRAAAMLWLNAFGSSNAEFIDPDDPHANIDDDGIISFERYRSRGVGIIPYAFKADRLMGPWIAGLADNPDLDLRNLTTSDLQTFATSMALGAYNVVFVKDTKGIYLWDPNIQHPKRKGENVLLEEVSCGDLRRGHTMVDGRRRRITRTGTDGAPQHLVEDNALAYMQQFGPERVFVVHPRHTRDPLQRVYIESRFDGMSRIVRHYPHQ